MLFESGVSEVLILWPAAPTLTREDHGLGDSVHGFSRSPELWLDSPSEGGEASPLGGGVPSRAAMESSDDTELKQSGTLSPCRVGASPWDTVTLPGGTTRSGSLWDTVTPPGGTARSGSLWDTVTSSSSPCDAAGLCCISMSTGCWRLRVAINASATLSG